MAVIQQGDQSLVRMDTPRREFPVHSLVRLGAAPSPTIGIVPSGCAGDCDRDGTVTVDEIVRLLAMALGNAPLGTCACQACSGQVCVAEIGADCILRAVDNALRGCRCPDRPRCDNPIDDG